MKKRNKWLYPLIPIALVLGFVGYVAYRTRHVPTPRRKWKRFYRREAEFLPEETYRKLQGIYRIHKGNDFFGNTTVAKWSYTVEAGRTIHQLSFFCERDGIYIICEGRQHGNKILLSGFWRKATANGTGLVRLEATARNLKYKPPHFVKHHLTIEGSYGNGNEEPNQPVSFSYDQPLPQQPPFDIIGHRGGARNVDFLPVSENSLAMLKMAAPLGLNGVEIDVRLTKDGVPVIFHDSFLSIHTVKDKVYGGTLHNYTLEELKKIELRKGGFTPTLDEYLHTALYQTPINTVWLDIKAECDLRTIHELQQKYLKRAEQEGRDLSIYIGIPDEAILNCFRQLEGYKKIPSLIELDPEIVIENNAQVWAMQYVNGIRRDEVEKIHAAGKKAYAWTLDSRKIIEMYVEGGNYDGIVTNAPSIAAFWYYTTGALKIKTRQPVTKGLFNSLENGYNRLLAIIGNAS